jgi:hypothetical protein
MELQSCVDLNINPCFDCNDLLNLAVRPKKTYAQDQLCFVIAGCLLLWLQKRK